MASGPSPTEPSPTRKTALAAVALLLVGCAQPASEPATPHPGVETAAIAVAGIDLTVWVADAADERSQGLRNVESLPEGIDGMIFVWDSPTSPLFGMRDTLIPLDLWWFGPDNLLIGKSEMSTCPDGDCVSYGSPGPVLRALETPAGIYTFEPGDLLTTSANG